MLKRAKCFYLISVGRRDGELARVEIRNSRSHDPSRLGDKPRDEMIMVYLGYFCGSPNNPLGKKKKRGCHETCLGSQKTDSSNFSVNENKLRYEDLREEHVPLEGTSVRTHRDYSTYFCNFGSNNPPPSLLLTDRPTAARHNGRRATPAKPPRTGTPRSARSCSLQNCLAQHSSHSVFLPAGSCSNCGIRYPNL